MEQKKNTNNRDIRIKNGNLLSYGNSTRRPAENTPKGYKEYYTSDCVSCKKSLYYEFYDGFVFPCMTYETIALKFGELPKKYQITTNKELFRELIKNNPKFLSWDANCYNLNGPVKENLVSIIESVKELDYPKFEKNISIVMHEYLKQLEDESPWCMMHSSCFQKFVKNEKINEINFIFDKKMKKKPLEGEIMLPWKKFNDLPLANHHTPCDYEYRQYIEISGEFILDYFALSEIPKRGQSLVRIIE